MPHSTSIEIQHEHFKHLTVLELTTCPKPRTNKTGFGQVEIMKEFV